MALLPFSEEQIIDRLRFENPWWISGQIEDYYASMERRLYFKMFVPLITETEIRRAIVLMGPRRVGKTVMMYHTIGHLLENSIDPLHIAYISIETPIYNNISLEQLFSFCRRATKKESLSGWYIFFDEIQYLKNWEVHLKSLVDSFPNTRFIVSGSSAAALRLKSIESGAGRFTDFLLPPLTFNEFIHLKKLSRLIVESTNDCDGGISVFFNTNNINELNRHFFDYINFGGYPEVLFSEKIQHNPGRYIRSDIIDKVLLRDLPGLYGIRDVQELNSLFTAIAYNSGGEFSLDELSKNSGVQKNTLKRYIEYLEAAFLIKVVHKISNKPKQFLRATQFKIYLTNPSLRSALFAPLQPNDPFIGNMVETAVYTQWLHNERFTPFYARWQKGEVDMVKLDEKNMSPQWAIEIKWSNQFFDKPGDLKPLIQFLKDNELEKAMVTTIDKEGSKEVGGLKFIFVPAAVYAYSVGRNIIMNMQSGID
jgi:predicted AAA+ superfamily ATPase